MNRLLNKTIRPLTLYALLVLVLSIPVYYFLVDYIWVNELDKHHLNIKAKIEQEMNALPLSDSALQHTLLVWNAVNPGSSFRETDASQVRPDSTYTQIRFDDFQQDREQFRGLRTYIRIHGRTYRLLLETNMEETDETILAIAGVTLLFFLLLSGGFILLNRRLSLRFWHPFYDTLQRLRSFNLEGEQNISLPQSDVLEFNELNRQLEELIGKNISVFRQQKEFTENAAHELQTPLAIIRSKLDILLQSSALSKEQYETVEAINRTLTRAYRINKNLLLLARIENRQFSERETIDLSLLTRECLELLQEHIAEKQLQVSTDIEDGVYIRGNRVLAEILSSNLLLNAIRHTKNGGNLHITLHKGLLRVRNSGSSALDPDALFRRFGRASTETPGTGLGLAIVQQIALRYDWQLNYTFAAREHIFSVRF
ncbi:MAG: sensor histidine kinase [Bacteroidia bacterium]|nr:sensor histidine kinase [Bacteroidia bacterium]